MVDLISSTGERLLNLSPSGIRISRLSPTVPISVCPARLFPVNNYVWPILFWVCQHWLNRIKILQCSLIISILLVYSKILWFFGDCLCPCEEFLNSSNSFCSSSYCPFPQTSFRRPVFIRSIIAKHSWLRNRMIFHRCDHTQNVGAAPREPKCKNLHYLK